MTIALIGLCRGSGKGYLKLSSSQPADQLWASATTGEGSQLSCPVYALSFPGEDFSRKQVVGEVPGRGVHTAIVAVPLLDDTDLQIQVGAKQEPVPEFTYRFNPLKSKVRSRLTYRKNPDLAYQMRDIDQRRRSGRTFVEPEGIYPVSDGEASLRFIVEFPNRFPGERCDIEFLDARGRKMNLRARVLEQSLDADALDHAVQVRRITYSAKIPDQAMTLCICAKPEHSDSNFVCIRPDEFTGLRNKILDLRLSSWYSPYYPEWFERHRSSQADLEWQREIIARWDNHPLISIVTAVFKPPVEFLQALIHSFKAQSYERFEVVFVNVSGEDIAIRQMLDSIDDSRFRVVTAENRSIAENTNVGIHAAKGEYIAFVDHDDLIEPDTLYRYVSAIREHPDADLLYCDEDLLRAGQYICPAFKPPYNPDLLYSNNYICHMLTVSRQVLEQVELSPADVSGAQDYDLALKCCEKARYVCHVPYMLYHWRSHPNSTSENMESKPYAQEAGKRALQRHFDRIGLKTEVSESKVLYRYNTRYVTPNRKVSIVIPTKDHVDLLSTCIESILDKTTYTNFEIILVENNSVESRTFEYYDRIQKTDSRIRVVTWPGKGFNYSAICNYGATFSDGELLLFLNNDTEIITPQWMESMTGFFERPEVGVVGAKLLYHDDLVQHGGIFATVNMVGCLGILMSRNDDGYLATLGYPCNTAAVTGACQMVRRDVFEQVGGLDESLAVVFNDVDLCLKIGQLGKLIVFDPDAMLYHDEHSSRGRDEADSRKTERSIIERSLFFNRWNKTFYRGQYINSNLNQQEGHYKLV